MSYFSHSQNEYNKFLEHGVRPSLFCREIILNKDTNSYLVFISEADLAKIVFFQAGGMGEGYYREKSSRT